MITFILFGIQSFIIIHLCIWPHVLCFISIDRTSSSWIIPCTLTRLLHHINIIIFECLKNIDVWCLFSQSSSSFIFLLKVDSIHIDFNLWSEIIHILESYLTDIRYRNWFNFIILIRFIKCIFFYLNVPERLNSWFCLQLTNWSLPSRCASDRFRILW